jgi:hypothetical protein
MEELQSKIQRIKQKFNFPVCLISLVYILVTGSDDLKWPVLKGRGDGPPPTFNT